MDMRMPTKDPNLLAFLLDWIAVHQPAIYGFLLSLVTAYLRVMCDGGSRRQRILESMMCGAISLSIMSAIEWFGVPSSASGFVGGMVGFLGVERVRQFAERLIGKKVDGNGQS